MIRIITKWSFLIALLSVVTLAQAQDKPLTFGIEGGVNMSNMTKDLKADLKVGFNLGVTLDYALTPDWYLLTGLKYSLEGAKYSEDSDEFEYSDGKLNLSYLKLPIHIGYKVSVSEGMKVVLHAGPYLAYAVDGTLKTGPLSVDIFSKEAKEALEDFKFSRFDMGVGLGVGAEFNKICVGLGADLGLMNILKEKNSSTLQSKPKGYNMNAYLTVGYKF